jgi:hypothetical protein
MLFSRFGHHAKGIAAEAAPVAAGCESGSGRPRDAENPASESGAAAELIAYEIDRA